MAEEINPTLPIHPPLPVTVPPDENRQQHPGKKKQEKEGSEQSENEDKKQQPHGLFDEFV